MSNRIRVYNPIPLNAANLQAVGCVMTFGAQVITGVKTFTVDVVLHEISNVYRFVKTSEDLAAIIAAEGAKNYFLENGLHALSGTVNIAAAGTKILGNKLSRVQYATNIVGFSVAAANAVLDGFVIEVTDDLVSHGIQVAAGGTRCVIQNMEIGNVGLGTNTPVAILIEGDDCFVFNNKITGAGWTDGIVVNAVAGAKLEQNFITGTTGNGIDIQGAASDGSILSNRMEATTAVALLMGNAITGAWIVTGNLGRTLGVTWGTTVGVITPLGNRF